MIIPLAPPPPLQIPANPNCPGFSAWTIWARIRAPDMLNGAKFKIYLIDGRKTRNPIGWPSETAPP
jgi:hypothetical protein